jgi:hypothetical protein
MWLGIWFNDDLLEVVVLHQFQRVGESTMMPPLWSARIARLRNRERICGGEDGSMVTI